jgi:electron transfer flavoprotein beta subunit
MNILVCIKQVPDTDEIKIDEVNKTLVRTGVPSIINPFDSYALEFALRIKDKSKEFSTVTAISMGPKQAQIALQSCLALGIDSAYLINDPKFGGSDTLATSYILSESIKKIEKEKKRNFDLILCGKQAIDGDTAQVGPELACHLNYPQITYVSDINFSNISKGLQFKRETDEGFQIVECNLPCVVTITKPSFEPRIATLKSKIQAKKKTITILTLSDLTDIDSSLIGLKGSPTRVKSTYVANISKKGILIDEENTNKTADLMTEILIKKGII